MTTIYQKIIDDVLSGIQNHTYKSGQKLPSIRQLSKEYQCSKDTVQKAMLELKYQKKIYSVSKSGYYILEDQDFKESSVDLNPDDFQELPYEDFRICLHESLKGRENYLFNYYHQQEGLAGFYKINLSKAELEKQRWKNIQTGQAKTYPAWLLYDGLMYRYMERTDLTASQETYLASHVRIATGLYGLISPLTLISPHRLDFQCPLKIDGKSLKQVWRYHYDSEVAEDGPILSLASSEFEQVFSPEVQNKLVRVLFMEEKDGKVKTHSTISKKGRGRMLSWLVKHQVTDIRQVQAFNSDGYSYIAEQSSNDSLVFIRKA